MIYCILGQTASGKTSLALSLARNYNLPIISADAYQCYRMMQIGTDKPSQEEREGLEYYFCDCYNPDENVDVALFQKTMRPVLERYLREGKDVLLVGGTFLYIKALLYPYTFTESPGKEDYNKYTLPELQKMLLERDKETYECIDNKNPRRVIRALAQLDAGIHRKDILKENNNRPLYPVSFLCIDIAKEEGNRKIDDRVEKMFSEGFPEEVKRLFSLYPKDLRSFLAIGYKEFIDGEKEGLSLDEIKDLIKVHTHQYAKKQRTFLAHQFALDFKGNKDEVYRHIENDILFHERTAILLSPLVLNQIEQKRVLIAGLGGVGGETLLSLVRLGVRDFYLIDDDDIEPSNLNRQALYHYEDIGKKKAEIARKRVKEIAPLARVRILSQRIVSSLSLPEEPFDAVFDCIDDLEGKSLLYFKAKKDQSIYLTSMGMGYHIDSTKIRYGKLKDAFDVLSKNFKAKLREKGVKEKEIDGIDCVYCTAGKIKGRKNAKKVGSLSFVPNGAGLALGSLFLAKIMEETSDGK